jgi:hypothetical protein
MKVYMIQDADTGLFYKRRGGWVEQDKGAAIWTNKAGVTAGKGSYRIRGHNIVVRTFRLEEE